MIKFKEFNRKWKAVVREVVERIEKEGLLNIEKEPVLWIEEATVLTEEGNSVKPDMIGASIKPDLYIVNGGKVLATEKDISYTVDKVIRKYLDNEIEKEKMKVSDKEYEILLDLLKETVIVSINNKNDKNVDNLPIFRTMVPKLGYVKVYPNYRETINGQNKTRKTLTIEELSKEILGEFRRRMRLKDKWYVTSFELYEDYAWENKIETDNLERRLELLREKAPAVRRGDISAKHFVALFTAISREEIDEMPIVELDIIKDALLNLATAYDIYRNGGKIKIERYIPPYFKVSIKFK